MTGISPAMRRVIFLNRFYWPEEPATAQLLTDLAEALAADGHDVTVIASHPGGAQVPRFEIRRGVIIRRVQSTRWRGIPGKVMNFITFSLGALWRLLFTVQRGDQVVALTDPPLLGVGAWLLARLCGARIFHWVQDIYPEVAVILTGHRWLNAMRPLRNLAWRHSDGCVTLGSDMANTLTDAGVQPSKFVVSPNWAPAGLSLASEGDANPLRDTWQLQGKFIVAYAGNLGRVHDLDPVLDVASALRGEPDIAFVFIGAGAQRGRLESEAQRRGLVHVHFQPPQPRAELSATLSAGDLHLVTLLPGCEAVVFPSKLYGIATAGRPVIFIGPKNSEISQLVTARGIGETFTRNNIDGIAGRICALRDNPGELRRLGAAAAEFGRQHAGPTAAAFVWAGLFDSTS